MVFTFVVSSIVIFCFLFIILKKLMKYLKQNTAIFNKTENQVENPMDLSLPTCQESKNKPNDPEPSSNESKVKTDKELGLDFDVEDFINPPEPENGKNKSILGLGGIASLLLTCSSYVILMIGGVYFDWKIDYVMATLMYLLTNIIISFVLPVMFFVRQPKCIQIVFNTLLQKC